MLTAVAGFSGAGKTTVLKLLEAAGFGQIFYLGGRLRDEVISRGLAPTPANEKAVRAQLVAEHGVGALARRALADIRAQSAQAPVLLDAVCTVEEWKVYEGGLEPPLTLIAIEAPFEARVGRVAARVGRVMTREDLLARDSFERDRMHAVFGIAHHRVTNDGALETLEARVRHLQSELALIQRP